MMASIDVGNIFQILAFAFAVGVFYTSTNNQIENNKKSVEGMGANLKLYIQKELSDVKRDINEEIMELRKEIIEIKTKQDKFEDY